MKVRVRLFASLREAVGRDEVAVELPDGATPEDVWRGLCESHPDVRPRRRSLAVAVNRRYAPFDAALEDGDELVFIPPVAGG
jgi:molybdopterin converting factor subunit 1